MKYGPFEFVTLYGNNRGTWDRYMTRLRAGHLRFHIFHRGDRDPDPHTHPWDFWTFPLTSYFEDVLLPMTPYLARHRARMRLMLAAGHTRIRDGAGREVGLLIRVDLDTITVRRKVRAFRLHWRPARYAHRVIGAAGPVLEGGVTGRYHYLVRAGRIYTIVWTGGAEHPWGFWKLCAAGYRKLVGWRDYINGTGRTAPCVEIEGAITDDRAA